MPEGQAPLDTGFHRDYGRNPYRGYDDIDSTPFLLSGPPDPRLPPMERVVAITLGVFLPQIGGYAVTLVARGDAFTDLETRSTWNILGKAVAGPLAGYQLPAVVHGDHFAFAWLVFKPQTQIYGQ